VRAGWTAPQRKLGVGGKVARGTDPVPTPPCTTGPADVARPARCRWFSGVPLRTCSRTSWCTGRRRNTHRVPFPVPTGWLLHERRPRRHRSLTHRCTCECGTRRAGTGTAPWPDRSHARLRPRTGHRRRASRGDGAGEYPPTTAALVDQVPGPVGAGDPARSGAGPVGVGLPGAQPGRLPGCGAVEGPSRGQWIPGACRRRLPGDSATRAAAGRARRGWDRAGPRVGPAGRAGPDLYRRPCLVGQCSARRAVSPCISRHAAASFHREVLS
jgi:hypothetical protein